MAEDVGTFSGAGTSLLAGSKVYNGMGEVPGAVVRDFDTAAGRKLSSNVGKLDQYGKVSAEYRGIATAEDVQKVVKVENGQFTDWSVKDIAQLASKNSDADTTTLGKWQPNANSYEQVAYEKGSAYYDLGNDGWNMAEVALKENGIVDKIQIKNEMWRINQQYLDDRIKIGNTFEFTSNPSDFLPKSFGAREYKYLVSKGYKLVNENGMWRMIK
ncbi:hypothetical protein [Lactovum odontotermitis]